MPELSAHVAEALRSLPSRYLAAEPGFDAAYHIRLGDIGRSWEVRCTPIGARVRAGAGRREPDVVIGTDVERWLPSAEHVVLEGCGHVPQVERPERTNGLLERFVARVDPLGSSRLRAA